MFRLMLLLSLVGCEDEDKEVGTADDSSTACNEANEACGPDNCSGDSPEMLPGSECQACHSPGNLEDDKGGGPDGPSPYPEDDEFFTLSGTVFGDMDGTTAEPDAIVRITDADGVVVEANANRVGNFYSGRSFTFPITAEVEVDGEVIAMVTEVETGDCSSCHQCGGAAGGKLVGP